MATVNCPFYCTDCIHSHYDGDIMVGSDATGGGPEESYSCRKGRDMEHYWFHDIPCPEYENMDSFD